MNQRQGPVSGIGALLFLCAARGWADEALSGELIVFHAGSLSVPFKAVAAAFQHAHPGVRVQLEADGSRQCARKISELGKPCDVIAVSDYSVIETLLIPNHARWNIPFAGNEMIIAYTAASRQADHLTATNWPDVLLAPEVAFGRSDPNADPCGYRAVLTMKLAENHYRRPGLADQLVAKDQRHIRPKETDLLALLEAHEIDYVFLYRSVAEQHQLKYVTLPDEINFKSPALAKHYQSVALALLGKTPESTVVQRGELIQYGVTIPEKAPHPALALAFVQFLLQRENGLAIMERNGQRALIPAEIEQYDVIPEALRSFVRPVARP